MEPSITYDSSSKFRLSVGFLLFVSALGILFYKSNELSNLELVSILLLIILSGNLIRQSLNEMGRIEDAERRYKQELTISEIIRQDLLLIDKEFKEMEYNSKIQEYNKKNQGHPKPYFNSRKIDAIASQALNPNFYEETYINKNKKESKSVWKKLKLKLFKK